MVEKEKIKKFMEEKEKREKADIKKTLSGLSEEGIDEMLNQVLKEDVSLEEKKKVKERLMEDRKMPEEMVKLGTEIEEKSVEDLVKCIDCFRRTKNVYQMRVEQIDKKSEETNDKETKVLLEKEKKQLTEKIEKYKKLITDLNKEKEDLIKIKEKVTKQLFKRQLMN